MTKEDQKLFRLSFERWGEVSQMLMLAEESSELSVACLHTLRANKDHKQAKENFAEEIADVLFMIDEFLFMFPDLCVKVDGYRAVKAQKLSKLLNLE